MNPTILGFDGLPRRGGHRHFDVVRITEQRTATAGEQHAEQHLTHDNPFRRPEATRAPASTSPPGRPLNTHAGAERPHPPTTGRPMLRGSSSGTTGRRP